MDAEDDLTHHRIRWDQEVGVRDDQLVLVIQANCNCGWSDKGIVFPDE